ncbi:hypothetical protein Mapa_012813 [Marchantia paleacea]|nr:hypothetical protein Mapa_012813 [Marchantia paleacea]
MGNAYSIWGCLEVYTRQKVVQIVQADGKYEEFPDPLKVSVVMRMYPDHLVVHCSSLDRPTGGALSKIMIMRPDQELAVGQSYLLHPIPAQYRKTIFKAYSIPLPKSPLGLGRDTEGLLHSFRKTRSLKKLNGKRKKRVAALRELCAALLQPLQPVPIGSSIASTDKVSDSGPSIMSSCRRRASLALALTKDISEAPNAPLLDSRVANSDSADDKPKTSFGCDGWRPALDSIPESPGRSFGSDFQTNTLRYHLLVDHCQDGFC